MSEASARKFIRRPLTVNAYLYTREGWPLGPCEFEDVSQGGAKLSHSISDHIPAEVIVALSRDGRVTRHREVVWRSGNSIGVKFKHEDDRGMK